MGQVVLGVEADAATWSSGIAAGAGSHLPVGYYGSAHYRSAMRFGAPAGWNAWTAITKATLFFYISDHNHVGPKNSSILCARQNSSALWLKAAGSQDCESGFSAGNTTQYSDLDIASADRVTFSSGSTANAPKSLDVTGAVRYYWSGLLAKLVFVFDANGADQYTEIWADERSGYNATLTIDYEDAAPPLAPTQTAPLAGATSQLDKPVFSWVHNDPNPQSNASVRIWDAAGTTLVYTWNPPVGSAQTLTAPVALAHGTVYQWDVATADAVSGYGLPSAKRSFTTKGDPVVTIGERKMVFANGAPRLVVEWTSSQPQATYRVTAPGYDSGVLSGSEQSHTLASLALTSGTAVNVTVTVTNADSPALTGSASRSFTPRYGLTTHKKTLLGVPVNWQVPVVLSTVPTGASLVIEYGSAGSAAAGAPTSGWFSSIASVPKTQYLWWRAWFIPSATQGPTLDSIDIPYNQTTALVDKWGAVPVWPWEDSGALPSGFSIDTGESVYGTRSLRFDGDGTIHAVFSAKFKVRAGRSYVLSGLMRSQGASGAFFQLQSDSTVLVYGPAVPASAGLTEWERYKTEVYVATADMTAFVVLVGLGAVETSAWFDGIKVEEAIVATPWNPASVGATTLDAGGLQVMGDKGGIFRYRGTLGGVRDVVEGGVSGLKFGGDTELTSPSDGALAVDGTVISLVGHSHGSSDSGAAFPAQPAYGNNRPFYRTDLAMEFFYNGTLWLSTTLFVRPFLRYAAFNPMSNTLADADRWGVSSSHGGTDLYLVDFNLEFLVAGGTALSASHKWVGLLKKYTAAAVATTVGTINIDSGASSADRRLTQSINALLGMTNLLVSTGWTKTGTPGPLTVWPELTYRVVAT